MILDKLSKAKLIHPPPWLINNLHYLTIMGSDAYGCSSGSSDVDIYGFCIPPKEVVFPWLTGAIPGFGTQPPVFGQWQEHHVKDLDTNKEYDFQVFNVVKYLDLAMENNPNILDSLFTPTRCVMYGSPAAGHIRGKRLIILHKGAYHKLRGYAFAQMKKIKNKVNSSNPKRAESIQEHGYDTKFAYHVARLCLQCEQILATHDLDLERDRELYKSIRRGEWSIERLEEWFTNKLNALETLYANSKLRNVPDEPAVKALLMECLEFQYGSIDGLLNIQRADAMPDMIAEIDNVLRKYR